MLHILAQNATTASAVEPYDFLQFAFLSVLYGTVEGLTEFLPVSSTAHLRIVEAGTGIHMESGYWKMYSVVIQLGAILSVPLLFRSRIMEFIRTFPRGADGSKTPWTHPLTLVALGFCVTAGPCYFADKYIGENLENLAVIAMSLIFGGIIMWIVDVWCSRPRVMHMESMKPWHAVWIGLVQILSAVFPGTSRSMSTIAAGQIAGLSRTTALEYSFFLSMPTMLAATGYKLLQAVARRPRTAEEIAAYHAPPGEWWILIIGFIVSFVVAWVVNRWFLNWVKSRGFVPFAVYRIVFGMLVLLMAWRMGPGS